MASNPQDPPDAETVAVKTLTGLLVSIVEEITKWLENPPPGLARRDQAVYNHVARCLKLWMPTITGERREILRAYARAEVLALAGEYREKALARRPDSPVAEQWREAAEMAEKRGGK